MYIRMSKITFVLVLNWIPRLESYKGAMEVHLHTFLNSALDWGRWSGADPAALCQGKPALIRESVINPLKSRITSCLRQESNHDSSVIQPIASSLYQLSYPNSLCVLVQIIYKIVTLVGPRRKHWFIAKFTCQKLTYDYMCDICFKCRCIY
jgi:hypothetical protein